MQNSWLIACALALGLAPVIFALVQNLKARILCMGILIGVAFGVSTYADSQWTFPALEEEITFRPIQDPQNNYVTSDSCRSCHPGQYATWHRSYHRTMTQPATPENVIGNFDNHEVTAYGEKYILTREGDRYFVDAPHWKKERKDGSFPRVRREFVMLTGSHHMQVYWYNEGKHRNLQHFDLVYVKETQTWVPRLATFITPPSRDSNPKSMGSAKWEEACIGCHVTNGKPRVHRVKGTADTRMSEFGIACEACHGEAKDHIQKHKNPLTRYTSHYTDEEDKSVVNPTSLTTRTSSQVCGQCHSLRSFMSGKLQVHWKSGGGDPYRPGDDLEDTEMVFQFPHPKPEQAAVQQYLLDGLPGFTSGSFWPDGMVRVVGREYNMLLKSPCYSEEETKQPFTCMSCHSMHANDTSADAVEQWADDQLKPGMRTNEACYQCHDDFRDKLTEHTNHKADSHGSLCYNCHMPPTTYGLYKSVHSHQISSPSVAESLGTGRNNACTNCHIDKTLTWASENLQNWYNHKPITIHPELDRAAFNIVLMLQGDAAQRALAVWAMSWEPAIEASGDDWQAPLVAELLDDPYDAVRFITHRTLKRFTPFENFEYNFVDNPEALAQAQEDARNTWFEVPDRNQTHLTSATLNAPDGTLLMDALTEILSRRDDAEIDIAE